MKQSFAAAVTTALAASISLKGEDWMYNDPWDQLEVTMDGQPLDLYLARTHWTELNPTSQASYDLGYNGRTYLSTKQNWDPNAYFKPKLLGGSLEYDVDLSQISCGCNAALYLIGMPGVNWDGTPFESDDGMHYCDANKVGGNYCPEFDIMEANSWAYKAISHSCNAPNANGFYDQCDHAGTCGADILVGHPETAYGPGDQYDINTQKEFHIKIDFKDVDGEFAGYTITFTQEGRTYQLAHTDQNCREELNKMTQDFKDGMTIAMSIWSSNDLDWLQHGVCEGTCTKQDLKFKNLTFTTAAGNNQEESEPEPESEEIEPESEEIEPESEEEEEHGDDLVADIKAGFEQIRNNAHYDDQALSRTLYQVDQTFDFIEETLIEMQAKLNSLDGNKTDDEKDENKDDDEEEQVPDEDDHEEDEQEEDDEQDADEEEEEEGEKWNGRDNPFEGKSLYVNPTYQANLQTSIATASGTAKQNLQKMRDVSSAYWIDVKAKLHGSDTTSLEGILTDAATKGDMVTLIVYDLPNRDCNAHASNGEICCKYNADGTCDYGYSGSCDAGLNEYKTEYIDVYADILSQFEGRVDIALIIEPDSLPNLATNLHNPHCVNSQSSYTEGIAYAINAFAAKAPSAAMYLDAAHGGWLGWADNIVKFLQIVQALPYEKLRGFSTNVANYQPLGIMCPWEGGPDRNDYCLNGQHQSEPCCQDPCGLTDEWNGAHSELNYAQALGKQFEGASWEPRFIIDTGRNGQPEARTDCANWCNIRDAGVGHLPTTATGHSSIDAYLWLKTPGESDGCSQTLPGGSQCPRFDEMCASFDSLGARWDEPRAPEAGGWFDYQVKQLAENASF